MNVVFFAIVALAFLFALISGTPAEVGKAAYTIRYDGGTSTFSGTGFFVTLTDGVTYLLPPDGTALPAITEVSVIAETGKGGVPVSFADDDEDVPAL